MPETTSHRQPERGADTATGQVADRVREAAPGLTALLHEAEAARRLRAEVAGGDGASAVCAWNHFENIPTFYNWNNRPR
ncbi:MULTISPECIES: multiple cyclophane-containing RiPP AmcA [unclassified Micromonospora]|uniref:multiple cyclophane-containing RiPP AmcA n=1 Tax=unclassified Micromonospora TaxID=2617518 RepID=UPI00332C2A47